ncbi:MAG: hypothetical protein ACI87O_003157 [Planctomycetota bacterium]|jgi:hypothetical protein
MRTITRITPTTATPMPALLIDSIPYESLWREPVGSSSPDASRGDDTRHCSVGDEGRWTQYTNESWTYSMWGAKLEIEVACMRARASKAYSESLFIPSGSMTQKCWAAGERRPHARAPTLHFRSAKTSKCIASTASAGFSASLSVGLQLWGPRVCGPGPCGGLGLKCLVPQAVWRTRPKS